MKWIYKYHTLIIFFSFIISVNSVFAKEVINTYHSDIRVLENSDMLVKETIEVKSEQNKIKRGIYRDFPLNYKDHLGNHYKVGFEIIEVRRNGNLENYHTKDTSKGIRIYIGNKNITISKGIHKYEITYKTNRQLGYFDEYDELYWNVTGNEWDFPIMQASASVTLPKDIHANDITLTGFTGPYGSEAKNFISNINHEGVSNFQTTEILQRHQGLSIVVNWPKGFVTEPDIKQKLLFLLKDNIGVYIGVIGLLLIIIYYLYVWSRVGKDPVEGIIFPHYEPPDGYSPASMRFIKSMGYDKTCFAAALVNLAVKRHITITEDDEGEYSLLKEEGSEKELAAGEKKLLNKLFKTSDILVLKQSNHSTISAAVDAHQDSLEKDYEKTYFITNSAHFYFGLAITFIVLIVSIISQLKLESAAPVLFMMVWLSIWSLAVCGLLANAWHAWQRAKSGLGFASAIGATVFAIPFLFFEVMVFIMLAKESSWSFPIMIVAAALINWLFYELLKAPTLAGRELFDKIEGFRRYIDVAEKHDLEYKYSGGKTPELFERILPFAIALEIEQSWGEQFEDVLSQATTADSNYSPGWYHGSNWHSHNISHFTSSLGNSLTNAVTSSSTAPGSSSGSGGGGFSGGGGGGGGGGGW
jgi:uncharacterized membrane protein YgcG